MPKRVMRRYVHRGKRRGKPLRGSQINFGEYGLQAMEVGWITNNQIESSRIAITRYVRRSGKLWIKIFPHKPLSKQPAETRMGKGKKGPPESWVAVVKPGRILFELGGVSLEDAKGAMERAAHKLPIKTKFVARNE